MHVPFADPYCPSGRAHAIEAARKAGWVPAGSGTLVVIDGPRFSTRAESQWYAAQGWTLIGMTGHPEAVLARELALCYTTLALVTDTDAGVDEGDGVTQAEVFEVFGKNMARLRELVAKHHRRVPGRARGRPVRARARRHQAPDRAALTRSVSRHPQTSQVGHFTNYRRGVWSVP